MRRGRTPVDPSSKGEGCRPACSKKGGTEMAAAGGALETARIPCNPGGVWGGMPAGVGKKKGPEKLRWKSVEA